MKVFKCILSGDEMFTDSVKYEVDGGFYIIEGKFVTRSADSVDESALGANPSAEEAAEDTEDAKTESGVNVLLDARMNETGFGTKKDYTTYMKEYMKAVMAKVGAGKSDEEIEKMKAETTASFKVALGKFKDLQFYSGSSMDPDAHIALVEWKDGTPFLYFYKHGIIEEKY